MYMYVVYDDKQLSILVVVSLPPQGGWRRSISFAIMMGVKGVGSLDWVHLGELNMHVLVILLRGFGTRKKRFIRQIDG